MLSNFVEKEPSNHCRSSCIIKTTYFRPPWVSSIGKKNASFDEDNRGVWSSIGRYDESCCISNDLLVKRESHVLDAVCQFFVDDSPRVCMRGGSKRVGDTWDEARINTRSNFFRHSIVYHCVRKVFSSLFHRGNIFFFIVTVHRFSGCIAGSVIFLVIHERVISEFHWN